MNVVSVAPLAGRSVWLNNSYCEYFYKLARRGVRGSRMSRHYSLVLETRQVHNHPMKYEKRRNGKSRHPTTQKVTYTPGELARLLGIARNGVYSALRNGKIPHIPSP